MVQTPAFSLAAVQFFHQTGCSYANLHGSNGSSGAKLSLSGGETVSPDQKTRFSFKSVRYLFKSSGCVFQKVITLLKLPISSSPAHSLQYINLFLTRFELKWGESNYSLSRSFISDAGNNRSQRNRLLSLSGSNWIVSVTISQECGMVTTF